MTQSVWVATRLSDDSSLTVGVFTSSEDAQEYIDRTESLSVLEWEVPRPGRQYWSARDRWYEYRIEVQVLRTSSASVAVEDMVVASRLWSGMNERLHVSD